MKKPAPQKSKPRSLHPRNVHQGRYDLAALCQVNPGLEPFITTNPAGLETIDFHNPQAVVALNQSLLKKYYGIDYWHIPEQALCPPIPGRADYIHYLADLLKDRYAIRSPKNERVRVLDVGTGASLIYPILGNRLYGWTFTATDIEARSLQSAQVIIDNNASLNGRIELMLQPQRRSVFDGVIQPGDFFHLTLCNPPFHASADEAQQGTQRKVKNLSSKRRQPPSAADKLNFGGQSNELWCPGGERAFVTRMMRESETYGQQVGWFSSLVSKSDNLSALKKVLKNSKVADFKVVTMTQGQKVSRFIAWTFMTSEELRRHAPSTDV